jgi:transcriptional regulator with XRE-family HTH domain
MNYSKALAIVRASHGLQQKDIADILGKSPSYISKIEKSERPMTRKMIGTLCQKLNVPIELFDLLASDKTNFDSQDSKTIDDLSKELLRIIVSK